MENGERELACIHHWRIEEAHGPTSRGVCKKCREERTFRNSVPEIDKYFDFERSRQFQISLDKREVELVPY